MTTLAERQAEFAHELAFDDLPDAVVRSVEQRFLDTLGIALAASALDTSRAVGEVATGWGGTPEASAIGVAQRLPAPSAALVNGTLAHSLDFDDTHLPSVLHPSASIVPAALAAAQLAGATGAERHRRGRGGVRDLRPAGDGRLRPRDGEQRLLREGPARHLDLRHDRRAVAAAKLLGLDRTGVLSRSGSPPAWVPA